MFSKRVWRRRRRPPIANVPAILLTTVIKSGPGCIGPVAVNSVKVPFIQIALSQQFEIYANPRGDSNRRAILAAALFR